MGASGLINLLGVALPCKLTAVLNLTRSMVGDRIMPVENLAQKVPRFINHNQKAVLRYTNHLQIGHLSLEIH